MDELQTHRHGDPHPADPAARLRRALANSYSPTHPDLSALAAAPTQPRFGSAFFDPDTAFRELGALLPKADDPEDDNDPAAADNAPADNARADDAADDDAADNDAAGNAPADRGLADNHRADSEPVSGDPDTETSPLADLSEDGLFDSLAAARRAAAAAEGRQILLIAELVQRRSRDAVCDLTGRPSRGGFSIGTRAIIEEVAQELALSTTMAGRLVETAMGLVTDTPDTLSDLLRGDIDLARATVILNLVQVLTATQTETNTDLPAGDQVDPGQLGRDLEKRLRPGAGTKTLAHLKAAGEKAQIDANPRAAEFRHRRARTRRYFTCYPDTDSMARLAAYLPADQGHLTKNALTRLAHHLRRLNPHDPRTLDQLRVDLMVEILTGAANSLHPDPPEGTQQTKAQQDQQDQQDGALPDQGDGSHRNDSSNDDAGPDGASHNGAGPDGASHNGAGPDGTGPDGECAEDEWVEDEHPDADGNPTGSEVTTRTSEVTARPSKAATRPQPTSANATNGTNSTSGTGCTSDTSGASGTGGASSTNGASSTSGASAKPIPHRRFPSSYPPRSTPGRPSPADPQIFITIDAETLTGANDHPAHLHGHGPIVASMARAVAATGTWRCAVTDSDHGTLLGLGTTTYTPRYVPSQLLRRHLAARDRTCRVPQCNRPAQLCDVDHRIPWPDGATCECGTECLCESHHLMKHETGFTLILSTNPKDPPGTLLWIGPTGRQYQSYPAVLRDPHPQHPDNPQEPDQPDESDHPGERDGCPACADADATIADERKAWETSTATRDHTKPDDNAPHRGSPATQSDSTEPHSTTADTEVSRLRLRNPIVPAPEPQDDGDPPPF